MVVLQKCCNACRKFNKTQLRTCSFLSFSSIPLRAWCGVEVSSGDASGGLIDSASSWQTPPVLRCHRDRLPVWQWWWWKTGREGRGGGILKHEETAQSWSFGQAVNLASLEHFLVSKSIIHLCAASPCNHEPQSVPWTSLLLQLLLKKAHKALLHSYLLTKHYKQALFFCIFSAASHGPHQQIEFAKLPWWLSHGSSHSL